MRVILVAIAALTLAGSAAADLAIPFRTPSGNIGCYYTSNRNLSASASSGIAACAIGRLPENSCIFRACLDI